MFSSRPSRRNHFEQSLTPADYGSGYHQSVEERRGNAYVHEGHTDEAADGPCRSVGGKNFLDIPRYNLVKGDDMQLLGYGKQGVGMVGAKGGQLAGTVAGRAYCCPRDATWAVVDTGKDRAFTGNKMVNKIHCCSGPLPPNRDAVTELFKNGCYARKSAFSRPQYYRGYAGEFNKDYLYNTDKQLDLSTNVADERSLVDDQSLAPYAADTVELEAADGSDGAAAELDSADGVPAEDVLAEAPTVLEFAAAPAVDHLL